MAVAARNQGSKRHAIAVIGDGAMSAGMALKRSTTPASPTTSDCWWC